MEESEEEVPPSPTMSELSSNLSYEYDRERSRQALCPVTAKACLENVLDHIGTLEDEEDLLTAQLSRPLAAHYLRRMYGRVDRTLAGEVLGDMVESELEDLQVDNSFEEIRGRVEGLSGASSDHLSEYDFEALRNGRQSPEQKEQLMGGTGDQTWAHRSQ